MQYFENRGNFVRIAIDRDAQSFGDDARNIFDKSAARNMRNPFDGTGLKEFEYGFDVNARGGQNHVRGGSAQLFVITQQLFFDRREQLPHQRVAVGMDPGRLQSDQLVARNDPRSVDDLVFARDPARKSCHIVLVEGIEAGHLGGFAADQGATCLLATFGNALDDRRDFLGHQLSAGDVVEKNQRTRALTYNVVDAHCDAVDADGIVAIEHESVFEFGADPVGAGDQNIAVGRVAQRIKSAERSEIADNVFVISFFDVLLHQRDGGISRFDVDARLFVINRHDFLLQKLF